MSIERRESLRQWAKETGISRKTLRLWLIVDVGCAFPDSRQGEKILVRQSLIEAAIRAHEVRQDATRQWAPGSRRSA